MTKSRIRRTGSGYQASVERVTRPGTGKPNSHSGAMRVDPTGSGEEGMSYLGRSPVLSGQIGLLHGQPGGTGREKSAEAIVALPGEGPNLAMQGADGRIR